MQYEASWAGEPARDLRLISIIDPVMADEIRDAAGLLSTNPIAHGQRAQRPLAGGMVYRFRARSGIVVRLRFTFDPPRNRVVIWQLLLTRTNG